MLAAVVGLALVGGAPIASADEAGPKPADRPVSTSPRPATPARAARVDLSAVAPAEAPPLTRAAVRHRIDEMSPLPWLARFGNVSIDRRE